MDSQPKVTQGASGDVVQHRGPIIDRENGFDIVDCTHCGFKHIIPVPDPAVLARVYQEEYYSNEKPNYLKHYEEDAAWWKLTYDDRYDYFESCLAPSQRRILDVGSGPGLFLLRGKERGWQTLGIEPSRHATEHARGMGLDIRQEFLTTETAGLGTFDVVHMSAVLEHIPNPIEMLTIAWRLLVPGGVICVVVPNEYSPFQKTLRAACGYKPWWLAPPHHINYFDFKSLSDVFRRAGFTVTQSTTTFPIDMFLLMGEDYTANPALGRECHKRRKSFELNLSRAGNDNLRRQLYQAMAALGIGREVVLYGKKASC